MEHKAIRRPARLFVAGASALILAVFLTMTGCPLPSTGGTLRVTIDPTGRGVMATMPEGLPPEAAAPLSLEAAMAKTGIKGSPKAWAYANKILFTLYKTGGGTYTFWESNSSGLAAITNGTSIGPIDISDVTAGTYTGVKVSIYNYAIDSSNPIVEGWGDSGFTITTGNTTTMSAVCTPISFVNLISNSWASTTSLPAKGEKWYRATASTGTTTFYMDFGSGSVQMYVFDVDGNYRWSITGQAPGAYYITRTTPSDQYYIVLYNSGSSASLATTKFHAGGVE